MRSIINPCRRQQRAYVMEKMAAIINEHSEWFPDYFSYGVPEDFKFIFSSGYSWNTIVASHDGQIAGFAVYSVESAYNNEYYEVGGYLTMTLRAIYVDENFRRQGVARRLIRYIASEGIENGVEDFDSLTWTCCAGYSVEFFRKCGLYVKKYLIERDTAGLVTYGGETNVRFLEKGIVTSENIGCFANATELLVDAILRRTAFDHEYVVAFKVVNWQTELEKSDLQTVVEFANGKVQAVLQYICRATEHNCSLMGNFKTAKLLIFGGEMVADEVTVGNLISSLLQREGIVNIDKLQFDVWSGDEAVAAVLENEFGFQKVNYVLTGKCEDIAEKNSEKEITLRAEAHEVFAGFWDGVDGEYIYYEDKEEMVEKIDEKNRGRKEMITPLSNL